MAVAGAFTAAIPPLPGRREAMRLGLLLLLGLAVLIVLAVVFRQQRAVEALRFIRKVAWIYVAVMIGLALWQLATDGL